ncbi:SAM-dependent methyltransferase [Cycloclasticus sp. PY97N]|uniref:Ribosomal RNA small subunit methyltransferase J n=1 Tax=Cycloclasticus pugetii TaxID=34068 RepID=A0AB33Z0J1_9GAMM|nr:SAM-dependent methyltransferase [Cycloclasticus sp. PY97N]EPD12698.1 SAM-dependent methyltransferase [Cycloclasticus pugetii]
MPSHFTVLVFKLKFGVIFLAGHILPFKPFPILLTEPSEPPPEIKYLINKGDYRLIGTDDTSEACLLIYNDRRLNLQLRTTNKPLQLCIDFINGKAKHRRQYGGGKNQPLAKACGLNKHPDWSILDATAGLGKDAFVLASLGAQVTLCERHPALYGLLADALDRATHDSSVADIADRMKCIYQDSITHLNTYQHINSKLPDVIYLDPMYPERKKSAKIKKEMQVLQYLVAHNSNNNELLETALKTAMHRVVVKRPKSAAPLNECFPSYTINSVNTRYDVYVNS